MLKLLPPRWQAAGRYLGWADPFYTWRISRSACPSCRGNYFLALKPNPFMVRCLSCGANVTNLSLLPVIQKHNASHGINTAWEMSTFGGTLKYLKEHFANVIESEYFPGVESGEHVDGIRNEDVQHLSFASESLDLITSSQVFEHVENDIQGYQECCRVLKKNGALIFSVPLYAIPATRQIAEIVNNDIVFHDKPEYHDSRSAGPNSILTFWHHSVHDICDRVAQAGFDVSLVDVMISPAQSIPSQVIYAVKI